MKEKTVYMYLTDTLLAPDSVLVFGDEPEPKVGYVTKAMSSFFGSSAKRADERVNRLSVLGVDVSGKMAVHFDGTDEITRDALLGMTSKDIECFFNIVERIYLTQNTDRVTIDEELSSSNAFNGYISNSMFVSSVFLNHTVTIEDVDIKLKLPTFFLFDFTIGGEEYTFKIWVSNKDFFEDYPKSIITNVICPCDPKYFLDFSRYKTILTAVVESGKFSFGKTDKAVGSDDHSGLFTYETKYNIQGATSTFMPFGIMYKGKLPSTLAIREAIRTELISSGIADSGTWESLFPDLFVKAQFYLIPMWHNFEVRPERVITPSIIKIKDMTHVLRLIFPELRAEYINNYAETIMNGYNEVFCATVPDPLNVDIMSLRELHPAYVYHPAQHPVHVYMDKDTQSFNIRFNRCMAVVYGASTSNEFVPVKLNDRTYMTFVNAGIEYYVLVESSYPFDQLDTL